MLTKRAMINRIKAITGGFRVTNKDVEVEQTEKSKQILDLLKKLGCAYNDYIKLCEVISGESISPFVKSDQNTAPKFAKPLVCLKIIKDINNNVKKDMLVVLTINHLSRFVINNGSIIDTPVYTQEVRIATDEEIDELSDEQLNYFIKEYTA